MRLHSHLFWSRHIDTEHDLGVTISTNASKLRGGAMVSVLYSGSDIIGTNPEMPSPDQTWKHILDSVGAEADWSATRVIARLLRKHAAEVESDPIRVMQAAQVA